MQKKEKSCGKVTGEGVMAFNKVILIGNLVADPELKKTPSGSSVTTIRIAVNRRFSRQNAQSDKPEADYFDVVCWNQTAEFVCRYFNKGRAILVCGRLQNNPWTDKNGQNRIKTEIIAEEVSFVGNRNDGTGNTQPAAEQPAKEVPSYDSGTEAGFTDLSTDDELPF